MSKKSIFALIAIFLVFSIFSATFGVLFANNLGYDGFSDIPILEDIIVRHNDHNKITFADGEIKVSSMLYQGSNKVVFICDSLKPNTYYDIKWSLDTDYNKDFFEVFSYKKINGEERYYILYSNETGDDFWMRDHTQIDLLFDDEFTFRSNADGKLTVIFGRLKNCDEGFNSLFFDFIGLINYIEIEEVK